MIIIILFNLVLVSLAWKFTHFYDDPDLRKPQQTRCLSTPGFIIAGNRIPIRINDSLPSGVFETFAVTTADGLKRKAGI